MKLLQKRLAEAKRFFVGEKYATTVSLASLHFDQGKFPACKECLDNLPTRDDLLDSLITKLKGKSIYKTLRRIHENKDIDDLTKVKGLSSLVTHCVIEMQSGGPEYGVLLPVLYERQEELLCELGLGIVSMAKQLARKVNKILTDMSLIPFDKGELTSAIDVLSDEAKAALEDAVKEKDVNKMFNILGMKQVTSFQEEIKNGR